MGDNRLGEVPARW